MNTVESKLKSRTKHERLRRRRFLAAATAIIVETDAKTTSSYRNAVTSDWVITWLINIQAVAEQTGNKVDRVEFDFVASVYRALQRQADRRQNDLDSGMFIT